MVCFPLHKHKRLKVAQYLMVSTGVVISNLHHHVLRFRLLRRYLFLAPYEIIGLKFSTEQEISES